MKLTRKEISELVDEMEELNFNGVVTLEAINMSVEKLQEIAPKMMKEMYDQKFENCQADVSIDFMGIEIIVLTEEKYRYADEDFDDMVQKYEEEVVGLMNYMKEVSSNN